LTLLRFPLFGPFDASPLEDVLVTSALGSGLVEGEPLGDVVDGGVVVDGFFAGALPLDGSFMLK
jgi:hypothetical protein